MPINYRAILYTISSEFKKAFSYYNKSIVEFSKSNNSIGKADCIFNLAILYLYKNLYDSSLKYQFEALRIREEIKLLDDVAISNINIGVIYFNKGYYNLALEYYIKAANYHEIEKNEDAPLAVNT